MTRKQIYLYALRSLSNAELALSYSNPTKYMTRTHLVLHKIEARRRGITL